MNVQSIMVALDGSVHARAALPVAGALTEILGATLHILSVASERRDPGDLLRELGIAPGEFPRLVVDQTTGPPGEAIVRIANGLPGPLIVMCTHTGAGKPAGALGSVAMTVLRRAPCPIVLVQPQRGLRPWALRRILLPHDGTPATAAAMDPAGELAHRTGAEVLVLCVAAPRARRQSGPGTLTTPRYLDQSHHEWPAWASEFLDRMTALGHPPAEVRFRLSVAAGEPGDEIVHFAHQHEVDLITLAWHGRWEAALALTMKRVIRDSAAPVFICRAEQT